MNCGADPNILSARMFERLSNAVKASMQPTNVKLVAANGKGIITHGRVTIPIHLEETTLLVPVLVEDIGEKAGILGMKFLREADCSIVFSTGILHCMAREWQLTSGGVGEQVQRVRVDLPENLATLANNAEGQMSVQVKSLSTRSPAEAFRSPCYGRWPSGKYRFIQAYYWYW